MHRCLFSVFIILCFNTVDVCAQQDFVQLKKGDRTVKTFFKGSFITFQTENYQWLTGRIFKVTNDSLYLYQITVRMMPNAWGLGMIPDTSVVGLVPLSMKNILAIPNERRSMLSKAGGVMKIGAAGFTALNVINSGLNKEPLFDERNKKRLGGALVTFFIGHLLKRTDPETYRLGKKYKLVYVKVTP